MRANNLSICIPDKGCNKNCPYCISKMTIPTEENENNFRRNIYKVKKIALAANVSSVLLTSKGEPLLNLEETCSLISQFNAWPVELQTNGILLRMDNSIFDTLVKAGLNIIAISIDKSEDIHRCQNIISKAHQEGLLVRFTINLLDEFLEKHPSAIIAACRAIDVDQLSFRKITVPKQAIYHSGFKARDWIIKNIHPVAVKVFEEELEKEFAKKQILREMPFGAVIYDVAGMSVTIFDYCIQERHTFEDIRSLIYQEDGHLYTNWNSRASRLF